MSNTLYLGKQIRVLGDNVDFRTATVNLTGAVVSVGTPTSDAHAVTKLYLDNKVSSILSNVDPAALDSFTEVVSAFQTADSNLNGAITSLAESAAAGLSAETTRAEAAELVLTNDLASEASRAQAAELVLTNDLASEASRAEAAELVLTNDLASEASRAQAAELVLTNNLASEASRALAAELVLTNGLASEASRALAAELVLTNDLASEVSRAQSVEAAIQARIDQICQYFFKTTTPF